MLLGSGDLTEKAQKQDTFIITSVFVALLLSLLMCSH